MMFLIRFQGHITVKPYIHSDPIITTQSYVTSGRSHSEPLLTHAFTHVRVNSTRPLVTQAKPSFTPAPTTQASTIASRPLGSPFDPLAVGTVTTTAPHAPACHNPAPTFSMCTGIVALPSIQQHSITTPIDASLLEFLLRPHYLAAYLIRSLRSGFRIGYTGPLCAPNLHSAFLHPEIIDKVLGKEITMDRIAGPFDEPPFADLHCSGLGLVPKDRTDWRLIFHLSAPPGHSINDSISPEEFSLTYNTIDDATSLLHQFDPGAKADLFRLCPVHPLDWPLLGIRWRNQYFVDKCLPFGLRSSPYLFNLVAEALQWCLSHHYGVTASFHYLEDFFFAGPHSPETVSGQSPASNRFAAS